MKKVKEVHGEKYEEFMMKKLVAIPGNICESDLGIDPLTANHIANNVHVIVNSAATTNFDERYDVALSVNTKGPSHLLSFVKTCKNVCLFLHISTAYVNDGRVGKIEETALVPMLDIENEMKLVSSLQENQHSNQKMKQLGLQRAKIHGWKSCYTFTKAMGEMKITSMIGDIPIVILRPTIIESTYKDPFPGQLPGLFVDPQVIADVVPVDMVVNAAIAAMAKHGISGIPNINVYQIGSSMVNPVTLGNIVDYTYEHFKCNPLLDSKGDEISISKTKYFSSIGDFSHYITTEITKESGLMEALINNVKPSLYTKLDRHCKKRVQFFIQMAKTYETFGFFKGR
ncbi:fatty acyl-CoA reductase 2-like [Senna tora]|uniref:Fatty acyl-CoA reductase n=1 Tax=Senna tora TaxID=362788 RepID=A0A834X1M8_9FABA|nr:fatty acyl-CoA reductase 2-like [Senna tora]